MECTDHGCQVTTFSVVCGHSAERVFVSVVATQVRRKYNPKLKGRFQAALAAAFFSPAPLKDESKGGASSGSSGGGGGGLAAAMAAAAAASDSHGGIDPHFSREHG